MERIGRSMLQTALSYVLPASNIESNGVNSVTASRQDLDAYSRSKPDSRQKNVKAGAKKDGKGDSLLVSGQNDVKAGAKKNGKENYLLVSGPKNEVAGVKKDGKGDSSLVSGQKSEVVAAKKGRKENSLVPKISKKALAGNKENGVAPSKAKTEAKSHAASRKKARVLKAKMAPNEVRKTSQGNDVAKKENPTKPKPSSKQKPHSAKPTKQLVSKANLKTDLGKKTKADVSSDSEEDILANLIRSKPKPKVDFRTMSCLPSAADIANKDLHVPKEKDQNCDLIERQFRLLREDICQPIREELSILLSKDSKVDKRKLSMLKQQTFEQVSFWDIDIPDHGTPSVLTSFLKPMDRHRRAGKDFWERNKKLLGKGSMVAFIRSGKLLRIGTVASKNTETLCKDGHFAKIGICFHDQDELEQTLSELRDGSMVSQTQMVQLSTTVFGTEPILKFLKQLKEVPMKDILEDFVEVESENSDESEDYDASENSDESEDYDDASENSDESEDYDDASENSDDDDDPPENSNLKDLDEVQRASFEKAFTDTVSLIQGPPGTGKSYIGALIAKSLVDTQERVLCVCYTNHALDQFLEELLDKGVDENCMVRLGSSPKMSDRISKISMRQQTRGHSPRSYSQDTFNVSWGKLKGKLEECRRNVTRETLMLTKAVNMENYLKSNEPRAFQSFTVVTTNLVGKKGKTVNFDYLWKSWINGAGLSDTISSGIRNTALWKKTKQERIDMWCGWKETIRRQSQNVANIKSFMEKANRQLNKLQGLATFSNFDAIKGKLVIGCTTTGAAMHRDILERFNANTVIVEEAGEVLEAHVLGSLTSDTSGLILIGDHQQLRPKVNNYEFQVESKKGFNLNKSLFERLVLSGFPHTSLECQHRMHPDISKVVRNMTYPNLRDAEGVEKLPMLRGFSNRLAFVNHNFPEDQTETSMSKKNTSEAHMVVSIVRYLLAHGYDGMDIVILVPYLGQLECINTLLNKSSMQTYIDDLDMGELLRAGIQDQKHHAKNSKTVQVATIDNFQGNEANIVVASLVRSNKEGEIGFVGGEQRVNVLFSRAKFGMIAVGSMSTLSKKSQCWKKLQHHLPVSNGMKIVCKHHPTEKTISAEELKKGSCSCNEACGMLLKCGHICPFKCHPTSHAKVKCNEEVSKECAQGHRFNHRCDDQNPNCPSCEAITKDAKKGAKRQKKQEAKQAKEEHQLLLDFLAKRALLKSLHDKESLDEIKKLKLELKDMEGKVREIFPKKSCCICSDDVEVYDGITCSNDHFLCKVCVESQLKTICENNYDKPLREAKGALRCFGDPGCDSELFSPRIIASCVSDKVYHLYMEAIKRLAREEKEKEMAKEQRRENDLSSKDKHFKIITETILTLSCPNGHPFLDFENCTALACSTCKAQFCAWCLKDCGDDAHPHVRQCPWRHSEEADPYFTTEDRYNRIQENRKKHLLKEYLEGNVEERSLREELHREATLLI